MSTSENTVQCIKCQSRTIKQGFSRHNIQQYLCKNSLCKHRFYEGAKKRKIEELKEDEKRCNQCTVIKQKTEFNSNKNTYDGISFICKNCDTSNTKCRDYFKCLVMRKWLSGKKCKDCGISDIDVLENDHINDDKQIQKNGNRIQRLKSNSLKNLRNELSKTEPVCVMCHRVRTFRRTSQSNNKRRVKFNKWMQMKKCELTKCANCQLAINEDNSYLFDFDHIDPTTKVDAVSNMCHDLKPMQLIENEIRKCQLLCANCHRKKTYANCNSKTLDFFNESQQKLAEQYLNGETLKYKTIWDIFGINGGSINTDQFKKNK